MKSFFSGTLLNVCKKNVLTKWPEKFACIAEISKEEVDGQCYRPLLRAAFKGDWESAKTFFERDSALKTAKITSRSETALHIAALSARVQFVKNLVKLLPPHSEVLEMVDCDGRTALHNAVLCGRIKMIEAIVRCNPKLTQLADNKGRVPLAMSALESSKHKEIAWFLAKNTTDDGPSHPFSSPSAIDFILNLTYAGHLDITLYLVRQYPHLLTKRSKKYDNRSILDVLARMQSNFRSGTRLNVLEEWIYKCIPEDLNFKTTDEYSNPVPIIKRVHEVKLRHMAAIELAKQVCSAVSSMSTTEITDFFQKREPLYQATIKGISELVKLCIIFFPELIRISPLKKRLTTHAVEFRQERTLRLFLKVSSINKSSFILAPALGESMGIMDEVAQYNPKFHDATNVSGAAFQMQRELQWYKAVEMWVIPSIRSYQFRNGPTYWDKFVENHNKLLKEGEKWVKHTANSCMLVSTLIATVLFAAAFTMPGGNDDKTGVPLLLGQDSLLVFAISDTLGLFSSVTAILLFLAILTSRYEPKDFLFSLPNKIIMGLSSLFLSLAFMLVAFAATLTIVLDKRLEWVRIPITLLTCIPVVLFLVLQLPLLYQMIRSTYGPSIFRAEEIWE
ncbi:ankyrin repeat-containing protein ITN1-like [Syzygium oleosum]|uniref:ankyrin repeat-containing protein ITN1-like n=1 Tax=Syzygium oleosum TaxID=219896 RepID=UPI0024BB5248|nr:ankyrin repeat-containing protein ITN1-like [Syzygium oleosum]